MYLYGSLALGDFDPRSSDIDYIVVTDGELPDRAVRGLERVHARFSAGSSPWSARIEAAYIPQDALHPNVPATARYPQVEKDRAFGLYPVESGWVLQLHTLREHGVAVEGPDPRELVPPIDPVDVRRASAAHAVVWASQARHDPEWLDWVRDRENQAFVVLTLCRMLYTLDSGTVASKPRAARWIVERMGTRWAGLVHGALSGHHEVGLASDGDVRDTIALIDYTVEQYQRWVTGAQAALETSEA